MSHINNVLTLIELPVGMLWGKADNTRAFEYSENGYIVYLSHISHRNYTFTIPENANNAQILHRVNTAIAHFQNFLAHDI